MGVIARSILIGGFVAGLITTALLSVTAYVFLSVGALAVDSAQRATRDRGVEIGHALARMAGEKFDGDMAVKLSAVMGQVVRLSKQAPASNFVIEEIMLLDAAGELMAHNDVALMAAEARKTYEGPRYNSALVAPFRDPTRLTSVDTASTADIPLYGLIDRLFPAGFVTVSAPAEANADGAESADRPTVQKPIYRFPEKVTTRTHISVAVFPVDQELPSGAVHIIVQHTATNAVVEALRGYSLETLGMMAGFVFLITAILILIMSLSFRDGGTPRRAAGPAATRRRKAPARTVLDDPANAPADEQGGIAAASRDSVLLDPKPANRARRRPVLPDPVVAGEPVLADQHRAPAPTAAAAPVSSGMAAAAADGAGYDDDDADEFIDDYADPVDYRDVYDLDAHRAARAAQAGPAPEAPAASGYRPGPRIMDAIPLEHFSRNKSAGGGGNARS